MALGNSERLAQLEVGDELVRPVRRVSSRVAGRVQSLHLKSIAIQEPEAVRLRIDSRVRGAHPVRPRPATIPVEV